MAVGRPTALALRASGLGDVMVIVPALRWLRNLLPEHRLVLAGPSGPAELVAAAGIVDAVVPARGFTPRWSGPAPDVAINLHGCGPQSHRALAAMRPRRLVAFANDEAGVIGPAWATDRVEHQRRRWVRLLAESWQVAAGDRGDRIDLPHAPYRDHCPSRLAGAAVVHPGAGSPARRWPVDRFASLARLLADAGWTVAVTGTATESALVAAVVDLAGRSTVHPVVDIDMLALAGLICSSGLVVCGDTGIGHVAAAFDRPSVHLMGPSDPAEWGPSGSRERHTVLWRGRHADPHARSIDPSLDSITVEEAVDAIHRLAMSPPD